MMYGSITWSICSKANLARVLRLQKVNKCSLTYKRINGEVGSNIFEALKLNSQKHARNTRHANLNLICPN